MAIERNTSPELTREIERQRNASSPAEKGLCDELTRALEGKRVRYKAPVYGTIVDYWCPTENLAVCLDHGMVASAATFETLRAHRVPVIFVAPAQIRGNLGNLVRDILALRPRAREHKAPVAVGTTATPMRADKAAKEVPKLSPPKSKPVSVVSRGRADPVIPTAYMKSISTDLRPGRPFYTLLLPNGKGVLHTDWVKFRMQFNSHKGIPAAAFDCKEDAQAWIQTLAAGSTGDEQPRTSKKHKKKKDGKPFEDHSKPETLPEIEITAEYRKALDILENTRQNVFITGKAGTGKSTLLKYFKLTTIKKLAVLAPTGVAAVNVHGQTIHSFFQFPLQYLSPDLYSDFKGASIHKKIEALIIDEISMVRAEVFDAIDSFLRTYGPYPGKPFGGVQIICFGDPYQIPPVVARELVDVFAGDIYKSPYFFSSKAFKQGDFICLELSKVYRQQEQRFVNILNQVRTGTLDEEGLRILNARVLHPDLSDPEPAMVLCTHNETVNVINEERLRRLPGNPRTYLAQTKGTFSYRELPVEKILHLKVGAQVMMLRNNPEKGYFNGTVAQVTALGDDFIEVDIRKRNGKARKIHVESEAFDQVRHTVSGGSVKGSVIGSLNQIPVRLAWAATIHKSQGRTLEKVILDLSRGAFEYGQTYVALSRCVSLEGLYLKEPIQMSDIKVHPIVEAFRQHSFPEQDYGDEEAEPIELLEGFDRALRAE